MKTGLFTGFMVVILSVWGYAQEDLKAEHRLSFSLGYGLLYRQDIIFSDFIDSDGSPINLQLEYRRSKKWDHRVGLSFAQFTLWSGEQYAYYWEADGEAYYTFPHSFTFVNANYHFGKKIITKPGFELITGGTLLNLVQATTYNYGTFNQFGYFASFGIGPWAEGLWRINEKQDLAAGISFPVISLVARSPYLINDDEYIQNNTSHNGIRTFFDYMADGNINTVNHLHLINFNLDYNYDLSEKWKIGLGYACQFIRQTEPREILSYQHNFLLTANFKL